MNEPDNSDQADPTLAEWIRLGAARLSADVLAPQSPNDAARIERLLEQASTARVVVLGELNHWIAEKSRFRLWWLERLARRRPLVLVEELGHSDGWRVARYLETGDSTWLDRVPTFGWTGDHRTDRDDRPTGVLRASFDRYPVARFKAAQTAFYRQLRAMSLHAFHGIDINGSAGAGYADIASRLEHRAADQARVAELLARRPGESVLEEADRLAQARGALDALLADDPDLAEAVAADVHTMEQTLRYQALAHPAPDYESLRPAMAWREDMMKRAVDRILDRMPPDRQLVLMAHALHLVKHDDGVTSGASAGPGDRLVHSLGHYIAEERGERVFSSWFLYGAGEDCQPFPDLPNTCAYPAQTLNAALATAATPLVIGTAHGTPRAPGDPVDIGHLYNLVARVNLARQVDAVFFMPTITPLPDV